MHAQPGTYLHVDHRCVVRPAERQAAAQEEPGELWGWGLQCYDRGQVQMLGIACCTRLARRFTARDDAGSEKRRRSHAHSTGVMLAPSHDMGPRQGAVCPRS